MKNSDLLKCIFNDIKKAHYVLIVISKDACIDEITSSLALSNYLFESKIKHKVFFLNSNLNRKLHFLSKFDKITNIMPKYYDLLITVGSREKIDSIFTKDNKIQIFAFLSQNINKTSSTSELIYDFFNINDIYISKQIAECLYTGIYDYSLGFTDNVNSSTFDIVSDLLTKGINISQITDNLLNTEPLSKFKALAKIMNTLELFNEGKVASVYLDDNLMMETGIHVDDCDEVLSSILTIGIIDIVVYFKRDKDKIQVLLKNKKNINITKIIQNFKIEKKNNFMMFSIKSNSIFETKEKVINTILNYI